MTQTKHDEIIPILMYHSISDIAQPQFKTFTVSPIRFRQQLTYLAEHHFHPITVSQFTQSIFSSTQLPSRPVILTFDDGFDDFYSAALPILSEFEFPATLYMTTSQIGGTSRWLEDAGEGNRPLLSWQHLTEIVNNGIECGAHSHTHPQLDRISTENARNEITLSKKILEDRLGREISSFAYPYGYYNQWVRQLVQEAGFSSACAVQHLVNRYSDDVFALRRLIVKTDTDDNGYGSILLSKSTKINRGIRYFRETAANFLRRHDIYPQQHKNIK